ncbi:MAG: histone deacetylase [Pseudonocardiaceae bacterium]
MATQPELVWYVSYGSNMSANRLKYYLAGGTPPGTQRPHPGCRDRRPPRRVIGCEIAGGVYFAPESATWGGGRAFFDPELAGTAAARAYLITAGQFADIAAQEMYGVAGADIDLGLVLATGRAELGPGRYETLLHIGDLDGHPLLTFTAPPPGMPATYRGRFPRRPICGCWRQDCARPTDGIFTK